MLIDELYLRSLRNDGYAVAKATSDHADDDHYEMTVQKKE